MDAGVGVFAATDVEDMKMRWADWGVRTESDKLTRLLRAAKWGSKEERPME